MKKEPQPIIRIEGENGASFYTRFEKNTDGEWRMKDKSFRKMFERHTVLEKPVTKDEE